MSPLHCTAGRRAVLALAGASLALCGCAGLKGPSGCPDVAGTYANPADGLRQHLSALLLPAGAENASRFGKLWLYHKTNSATAPAARCQVPACFMRVGHVRRQMPPGLVL